MRIFGLLAEFGELPARSLSSLSNIPFSRIHKPLFNLQQRGFIISYGEAPKLFALRYEYPERLKFEPKLSSLQEKNK
jgi:sugar-specific transcriptional regulator TrmB